MTGRPISKSLFVAGRQCVKQLWWRYHEPDAPELVPDATLQAIFDQGSEVGRLAQEYVPGGVLIDVPHTERQRRLDETRAAIEGGARVVYEAAFHYDGVLVVADIVERSALGWNLIEVKSTSSVKDVHLDDVAVQTHVLRGCGLDVRRAELMHLNSGCRHPDLTNLFTRADLTAEVQRLLPAVPATIDAQKRAIAGPLPEVEIGEHCHKPYSCPFMERCWPEPPPHAIGTLYQVGPGREREYHARGIETIYDLPPGERLRGAQARQRRAVLANEMIVEPGLARALARFRPPLAYLDFETIAPAVPRWPGCGPYQQVPVQFSVHLEHEDGTLEHHEWLAEGPEDAREPLARALVASLAGQRRIVVYNAKFEKGVIDRLSARLPQLASELDAIAGGLFDLLPVVRSNVYHPEFGGSFGIKSVLPALVPGEGYDALEIADGKTASASLQRLLFGSPPPPPDEEIRLRKALLDYCRLDTLAMVRLLSRLRELGSEAS